MTGYTVHTGATLKFVQGWDQIFSSKDKKEDSKTAKGKKAKGEGKVVEGKKTSKKEKGKKSSSGKKK